MIYKLLALDVDDTIVVNDGNIPSEAVQQAIRTIQHTVTVCFATARGAKNILTLLDCLALRNGYHVVENGAIVLTPDGVPAFHLNIPTAQVQSILDVTADLFDDVGFCSDSIWINQFDAPDTDTISIISLISKNKEKAQQIPQRLQQLPDRYTVAVSSHWSEPSWALTLISHAQATKGTGLSYVQRQLGITPAETVAIGDSITDLTMFPYAGLKIAMGNGEPALKQAADHITESVRNDGVAQAIQTFLIHNS